MKESIKDTDKIAVCDECWKASCWHGIFMCDAAREADVIFKTAKELRELGLENEDYWHKQ